MKFRYIFAVVLTGTLSLIIMVISHWGEISSLFGHKMPLATPSHTVSSTPTDEKNNKVNTTTPENNTDQVPTPTPIKQSPEVKALTQFINNQFEMAANLYDERLEIRKRKKTNSQYSHQDQKRLQEIHIAVYSYLKAIDDKINGATKPYLSRNGGTVQCGYYLKPHKLKERLGIIPSGYYRFEKAVMPFLTKSNSKLNENK